MSRYPYSYEYRVVGTKEWTRANGIWEKPSHAAQGAAERMAEGWERHCAIETRLCGVPD